MPRQDKHLTPALAVPMPMACVRVSPWGYSWFSKNKSGKWAQPLGHLDFQKGHFEVKLSEGSVI